MSSAPASCSPAPRAPAVARPQLWLYRVAPLLDAARFAAALTQLPAWRRDKALRYKTPQDRARSAGAALLLGHALRCAGLTWAQAGIQPDAHGKPQCAAGVGSVNLSHAGELAACVLCRGADAPPLGVDVERYERRFSTVLPRVTTAQERAYIDGLSDEAAQRQAFFDLWARKEACLKAVGLGFGLDPATLDVMPLDAPAVQVAFRGAHWCIRAYRLDTHALAVCGPAATALPDQPLWWDGPDWGDAASDSASTGTHRGDDTSTDVC